MERGKRNAIAPRTAETRVRGSSAGTTAAEEVAVSAPVPRFARTGSAFAFRMTTRSAGTATYTGTTPAARRRTSTRTASANAPTGPAICRVATLMTTRSAGTATYTGTTPVTRKRTSTRTAAITAAQMVNAVNPIVLASVMGPAMAAAEPVVGMIALDVAATLHASPGPATVFAA